MADISKFSPDGINEYNLKDAYAREVINDHKSMIGRIRKRNDIFTDASGNILSEWDIVMTPTNNNDFNSTLEYTYENGGNIDNLTKQANTVPMVILKNANGYTNKLLVDGLTENSKVFLLGNTPLSSDGNVERPYSIYYNLKKKSGKTIAAGDFKVKFEMDIAILNPNVTTPRKGAGYDVFELDIQDPSVVGYPYVGILDGRSNGYMRCAGTETRSGYSNGFMYKYLGNFPIGEWATLRIEVNGLDHVSTYVNDVLYDDDLNNPLDKSTVPDGENGNIGLTFGDFDYVICKEIRCMNCNKEKFEEVQSTYSSQEVHATAISLSPSTVSFSTAGETSTITATLTPSNTTDTVTSWASSDNTVATVSNGVITAVADGSATITAITSNGLTATVSVTVSIPQGGGGITVPNDYSYSMTTPTTFDSNTRQIDTNLKLQSSNAGAYSLVIEWDNPTPITDATQVLMSCGYPADDGYQEGWSVNNFKAGNATFIVSSGGPFTNLTNVEQTNKQVLILTRHKGADNLRAYANSTTAIDCPLENKIHSRKWILGCDVNGTPRFTGTIYSAYKYDRVLTAEEISSIIS